MDTANLRASTRLEHEAVEAQMPLMDAGLTREQYVGVLQCMYRAVRPWEDWATVHAPPRLAVLAAERRRAYLIEADLHFLGASIPETDGSDELRSVFAETTADDVSFEAAFLGAMYVVEGSTLGGQYIAHHVEELFGLMPGVGDAYFRGYGEQTGSKWLSFKELLLAVPDEDADTVIASAKAMFDYFGKALEPSPLRLADLPTRHDTGIPR